jgi:GMP synthase (glutamine-hydrolysing)
MKVSKVLILDYGSQFTQLIARRLRELNVYSYVIPGDSDLSRIQEFKPDALILSGGPSSVYDTDAPQLPKGLMDFQAQTKMPMLGVCYGMQLLVQNFGGKVARGAHREYGRMGLMPTKDSHFFIGPIGLTNPATSFDVWMSHGDETTAIPAGFKLSAQSAKGAVAAIESPEKNIYGIQFHPEVTHTERGIEILKRFIFGIAKLEANWTMGNLEESLIAQIRATIPTGQHVICALSGGVDSTVAATLVQRAIACIVFS